jgi:hypothetical protein
MAKIQHVFPGFSPDGCIYSMNFIRANTEDKEWPIEMERLPQILHSAYRSPHSNCKTWWLLT